MGLIKAALGAAGGVLADQWKEYFYCDSLDSDVLAVKGRKRTEVIQEMPEIIQENRLQSRKIINIVQNREARENTQRKLL